MIILLFCELDKLHFFANFGLWVGLCDLQTRLRNGQVCAMCAGSSIWRREKTK